MQELFDEKKREEAAAAENEQEIEVEVTDAQPEEAAGEEAQEEPTQEQWREALELAVKQRDEYLALAQRAQADYQNFKRRNQQTRTEAYDEGVRETLTAMLPALDNLERAIAAAGIAALEKESGRKVHISVEPFKSFYAAEEEHQDYYRKHPEEFQQELIDSGRLKA